MSLRKQAEILGTSHANLSRMISGKRKWNPQLKARYDALVGTTLVPVGGNGGTGEHDHKSGNMHLQAQNAMVSRVGLEPTTLGLKVRCSTRLSYRPTTT